MGIHSIVTPRGAVFHTRSGEAELFWHPGMGREWSERFNRAQYYLDSEVLRQSEPYTPKLTGMLSISGTLGTVPGSGEVAWIAPYARRQYYNRRPPGRETGPLRGGHWYDRMMVDHGGGIIAGVKSRMR
jgi:hypothetical protein